MDQNISSRPHWVWHRPSLNHPWAIIGRTANRDQAVRLVRSVFNGDVLILPAGQKPPDDRTTAAVET